MIMKIAVAKDGFIDTKNNPTFAGTENFIECLEKIFTFEEKDLMEFDGNTCQFINSYNPTNSIFIYTNQQGTFLYTITDATPRVHKNNFIWNCNCYKMEDASIINDILGSGKKAESIIYKNIAPSNYFFDETGSNNRVLLQDTPNYTADVKDNFRVQEVVKGHINLDYWCFKLKFLTNPTNDNTLVTKEPDGSYNFFFPFYVGAPTKTTDYLFPLASPTEAIKDDATNTLLTMQEIIKQYSTNLKSVEIIPFFPYGDNVLGGTLTMHPSGSWLVIDTYGGSAKWTDAGIFFPYGHTTKRSTSNNLTNGTFVGRIQNKLKGLVVGGGIRGKLVLPLGEIPLNFDAFRLSQKRSGTNGEISFYLKSEGWKLDGLVEADAPPHYLNFYTNETGQLFIANMTTNAQELRQLNRQYEYDKKMLSENYRLSQVNDLIDGAFQFASSGNLYESSLSFGQSALQNWVQYEFDKEKAKAEYNLSKANYDDKIKTQGLLASMTGKAISGNSLATDLVINLTRNFFMFICEANYTDYEYFDNDNVRYFYYKIPQKDYDYSTQFTSNEEKKLIVNKTGSYDWTNEYGSVAMFMRNLFGFDDDNIVGDNKIQYYDNLGLNYNITFKIVSLPNTMPTQYGIITDELEETQILNFAIRHKPKYFS